MEQKNYNVEMSVKCGETTDGFEKLKRLCEKEAEKLLKTMDVSSQDVHVSFWTSDIPELIAVGIFSKDEKGLVRYELDYSESTL